MEAGGVAEAVDGRLKEAEAEKKLNAPASLIECNKFDQNNRLGQMVLNFGTNLENPKFW